MPSKTFTRHLAAIEADAVAKSNILGLCRALNAVARRQSGYSVSRTAPAITFTEADDLLQAIYRMSPRITGELHASGIKLLRSPRYRKRLAPVQSIVDQLDYFQLVDFDETRPHGGGFVPVYRAVAKDGRDFTFRNIPWQSGGDGPEIL